MGAARSDIAPAYTGSGYSAEVRISVEVAGREYAVAQIGGDELTLREPAPLADLEGVVTMSIDGRARSWPVRLSPHSGCATVYRVSAPHA